MKSVFKSVIRTFQHSSSPPDLEAAVVRAMATEDGSEVLCLGHGVPSMTHSGDNVLACGAWILKVCWLLNSPMATDRLARWAMAKSHQVRPEN